MSPGRPRPLGRSSRKTLLVAVGMGVVVLSTAVFWMIRPSPQPAAAPLGAGRAEKV